MPISVRSAAPASIGAGSARLVRYEEPAIVESVAPGDPAPPAGGAEGTGDTGAPPDCPGGLGLVDAGVVLVDPGVVLVEAGVLVVPGVVLDAVLVPAEPGEVSSHMPSEMTIPAGHDCDAAGAAGALPGPEPWGHCPSALEQSPGWGASVTAFTVAVP
jgi:hypothetical protein